MRRFKVGWHLSYAGEQLAPKIARSAAHAVVQRLAPDVLTRLSRLDDLERHVAPITEAVSSEPRNVAIDFRIDEQKQRLAGWKHLEPIFQALRADSAINTTGSSSALHNGYFPTPDAEYYVGMINDVKPATIIEIGGGFSTLVARKTVDHLGLTSTIAVIDPEPRTDVAKAATETILAPVETIDVEAMAGGNSIVFIDSSHIARIGGDVAYLYCELIPSLPGSTVVHVHDIYSPYNYPEPVHQWWWTEQYVLEALLSNPTRYRVLLSAYHLSMSSPDLVQEVISPTAALAPHGGASFWFQIEG